MANGYSGGPYGRTPSGQGPTGTGSAYRTHGGQPAPSRGGSYGHHSPQGVPHVIPPAPIAGTGGAPSHMHSERRRNRRRAPLIALGVLAGLLVAGYIGGAVAFSNILYPHTQVAGVDVSFMSRDAAASRVQTAAKSYRLSVTGEGFNWDYKPEAGTEVIDARAAIDRIVDANEPLVWPARLVQSLMAGGGAAAQGAEEQDAENAVDLPDSFDTEAFSAELGKTVDAFNKERTGTFDFKGAYDEQSGTFTLDKARSNRKLDKAAIVKAALAAVANLDRTLELDDSSYEPFAGGATDEQLKAACDAANEIIGVNLDLKMGGASVAKLDGKQLAEWIEFDDKLAPKLKDDAVKNWVRNLALKSLDTVGTKRTYTREDGKKITVSGGTYGWTSNEKKLVAALEKAVEEKQTGEIDIPTKQQAARYAKHGERDWGAYVDVDISEQHARYYDENGKLLWESGIITGNPNKNYDTPQGVYYLNNRATDQTLIGATDPETGEPEYRTPVKYWMPFVGNAVGFHDANWQANSSFSNNKAYYSVGSHGCVNLPPAKAKSLYKVIKVGVAVVVHK